MSRASGWCLTQHHNDACRWPFCGCDCHGERAKTARIAGEIVGPTESVCALSTGPSHSLSHQRAGFDE